MNQIFLLILGFLTSFLASQEVFSPSLHHKAPRLLSPFVTKNGNIILTQDIFGFTAQVDFNYEYLDASDSNNDDNARFPMAISLYSSESFIVTDCLQYLWIDCTTFGCTQYPSWISNFTMPYYTVNGYYGFNRLYLDYGYYIVNNYITIATSCDTGMGIKYGNSSYGVIGLGLTGNNNFLNTIMFTISTNLSNATAQLLFKEDTERKAISTLVASLQTDSNWQISSPITNLYINNGTESTSYATTIIFDLDSDGIGLPKSTYETLIDWLEDYVPMTCDTSSYVKPFCNYNGFLTNLPVLQIKIQGYLIDIPPTIYASSQDPSNPYIYLDGFTLNFKAISPYLTGISYVTPQYENCTILDQNFLNYYFAEFSGMSGNSINLYTQYNDTYHPYVPPVPPSPVIWPYILGGIIGLIIIIIIVCWCCRTVKNRRAAREGPRVADSSALLIVNNGEPSLSDPQPQMSNGQDHQYTTNPYQRQPQSTQMSPNNYESLPEYTYVPSQNNYSTLPPTQGPAVGGNAQAHQITSNPFKRQ